MVLLKKVPAIGVLIAAVATGWACDEPLTPAADAAVAAMAPEFWQGCPGGSLFTGGGRIDVDGEEKWTFGFNLHAEDCTAIKGQMEVVHHPTHTTFHSSEWTRFASFEMDGGRCVEWEGVFRAKHGDGPWHEHDGFGDACDYGEPGSSPGEGPDTFRFNASGDDEASHANTGRTPLTGGNIQAH